MQSWLAQKIGRGQRWEVKGKTGHINEVKPWVTDVRKERDQFLLLFFPLSFTVTFLKNTYILASPCTILHLNLSALLLSLPLATKWSLSRRLPITSSYRYSKYKCHSNFFIILAAEKISITFPLKFFSIYSSMPGLFFRTGSNPVTRKDHMTLDSQST